jgi:transposase
VHWRSSALLRGKPKQRPRYLVGDKGYDAQRIRHTLRRQHTTPIIPKRKNAQCKPRFNRGLYRECHRIERLSNRPLAVSSSSYSWWKTSRELSGDADDCGDSYLVEIAHYAISRLCRSALVGRYFEVGGGAIAAEVAKLSQSYLSYPKMCTSSIRMSAIS